VDVQERKKEEYVDNFMKKEFHNLYFLPFTVKMIILRSIRWARLVASLGEVRNGYPVFLEIKNRRNIRGEG
jgi:hypothetical protein